MSENLKLNSPFSPFGGADRFGNTGAARALAFADPESGLAFGYAMNQMIPDLLGPDRRTAALIEAARDCV